MRRRFPALLLALVVLACPPRIASGEDSPQGLVAGLAAYFAGRFDQAAVALKRSLDARPGDASGTATYFLARSFQELGLRALALHYLGRAEGFERWRLPARRELARLYLEVHEHAAVLDVVRRGGEDELRDGEIAYLGGVAAAALGRWEKADRLLSRVGPDDPGHGYALYVRAQSHAARERFDEALADLGALVDDPADPALRDQARVLRGKILYLSGRPADARREFAAVRSEGALGYEALRGLLLAGAEAAEAERAKISEARPGDLAAMLTVRAVAAEERDDVASATAIREQLRALIAERLDALRRASAAGAGSGVLEEELGRFAGLLRLRRWARRWEEERESLGDELSGEIPSRAPETDARFEPRTPLFYEAWTQARANPWLRGSIELLARSRAFLADLERVPGPTPFWKLWGAETGRRLALGLAAIRLSDLERLFADHLHTQEVIDGDELRARKRRSCDRAVKTLRALYIGEARELPEALSNLSLHLEYKELDMRRLVEAAPERSTDPVTSLLGNYVDLLEDTRARLLDAGEDVPEDETTLDAVRGALERDGTRVAAAIGARIHDVVRPTLRRQVASFTRLGADNEGSLSRLYAREREVAREVE